MIITQEEQEKLVYEYAETHTPEEVYAFIDGLDAMFELITKNYKK